MSTVGGNRDCIAMSITQNSHGFVAGDVLKFASSVYAKAQADSEANAEVVGIVTRVKDANNFVLITSGYIETLSGLTSESTHFLSADTAGALTTVEPDISKPILYADTTGTGYVSIMRGMTGGGGGLSGWSGYSGVSGWSGTSGGFWSRTGAYTYLTNATDDVGIGTSTPSEKLHLADVGPCRIFIEADTNNSTESDTAELLMSQDGGVSVARFSIIESNNSLVIGVNSSTDPDIFFSTLGSGTAYPDEGDWKVAIRNNGDVDFLGGDITMGDSTGVDGDAYLKISGGVWNATSPGHQLAIGNNTTAFDASPFTGMVFYTRSSASTTLQPMASILCGKENASSGVEDGFLSLRTRNNGSTIYERFRISSEGVFTSGESDKFQFGEQSHLEYVDIWGSKETTNTIGHQLVIRDAETAYNASPVAGISFWGQNDAVPTYYNYGSLHVGKENTASGDEDGFMSFRVRKNGDSTNNERLRIDSEGVFTSGDNEYFKFGSEVSDEHLEIWGPSRKHWSSLGYQITVYDNTTAFNATPGPVAGIGFFCQENATPTYDIFGSIHVGKENTASNDEDGFMAFMVRNNSTGMDEHLRITSEGVFYSTENELFQFGDANNEGHISVYGDKVLTWYSIGYQLSIYDNTTAYNADPGPVAGVGFYGYKNATPTQSLFASIHGGKETTTSNDEAGFMSFMVSVDGGTLYEHFRITSGGVFYSPENEVFQFGDADNEGHLQIWGSKITASTIGHQLVIYDRNTAYNASPVAGISFYCQNDTSGTSWQPFGSIHVGKENTTNSNEDGFMSFRVRLNGDSTNNEYLRITSDGQIRFVGSTYYSGFTVGAQSADIDYTLPIAPPTKSGAKLTSTTGGAMSWKAGTEISEMNIGAYSGLHIYYAGLDRITLKYSAAAVWDSSAGETFMATSGTHTVVLGDSGANGLDGGIEASDTWYYVWVIYNPTTTTQAGLFSTSSTAPTMPAGYTYKKLVGVVRNNSSSNILKFNQAGSSYMYYEEYEILQNGSATGRTAVTTSSHIPAGFAIQGSYNIRCDANAETGDNKWVKIFADSSSNYFVIGSVKENEFGEGEDTQSHFFTINVPGTEIRYMCEASTVALDISVVGFEVKI